jgi:hypothetical protein
MAIATRTDDTEVGAYEHLVERYEGDTEGEGIATFAPGRGSPAQARHALAQVLRARGYDEDLIADAALVVSELAANAVRHARSHFSVLVRESDGVLRVAVEDARCGDRDELQMSAHPMHGLWLVAALAAVWGVETAPRGKVVWAELTLGDAGVNR